MKKLIYLILSLAFIATALCACELDRKLDGVELKFQSKISGATEYSFTTLITVTSDGTTAEMSVKCYKKNGEYAYVFANPSNDAEEYRRLYADGKLYEVLTVKQGTLLGEVEGGTYYQEEVKLSDEKNFLYQIEQNILLASLATIVLDPKKEEINGKTVYRYDLPVDENTYSLWYDDAYLVKIRAEIVTNGDDGNTTTDVYEATFDEYKFSEVDSTKFVRPSALPISYVESPTSIENIGILGNFSKMSANWAK